MWPFSISITTGDYEGSIRLDLNWDQMGRGNETFHLRKKKKVQQGDFKLTDVNDQSANWQTLFFDEKMQTQTPIAL